MSDAPMLPPPSEEPIVPVTSEIEKISQEKSKPSYHVLEKLPTDVKEDMENFMRSVNVNASKKYMVKKYGDLYPQIKDVSAASFRSYFKCHNVRMEKDLMLQTQSATPPQEILDVINAITSPDISIDDKRNALTALFNSCQARSQLLEQRQTNWIDPQLEALILANKKEQHAILKTVASLSEQLSKDSDAVFLKDIEDFIQIFLSRVYNTYKLTNGNTNFSLFYSTLDEEMKNTFRTYKAAREQLKKEVSKPT